LINEDKINLYRDSKLGVAAAPFSDFFHMIEFSVDEMKWKLNEPKIDLKMVAADDAAVSHHSTIIENMPTKKFKVF
jgi:hypothetical protein